MVLIGSLFGLPQQFFATACVPGEAPQPADAASSSQQQERAAAAAPRQAGDSGAAGTSAAASGASSSWRESGATCLTCGIGVGGPGFSTPQEQREHFKTDWHRYNVKRRLAKQPAVSEEQFERVLEQGTEVSISGSESGDSDDDEDDEDEEGGEGGAAEGGGEVAGGGRRRGQRQPVPAAIPRVTFQSQDGTPFSVWRCLLRQDHVKAPAGQPTTPGELLAELRRLRGACGTWMVVLLRGGHFAATVFKARETRASNSAKHDSDALEGFDVVAHKTFHRYVVRAKAGGKQSSKDATGKFARSAGSRLRRYNEVALERDIVELLSSWSPHIATADLIFVHAPSSNARTLFSDAQTALLQSNPRLRRVPFVTHRPTFSETKRVARLLTAVFRPEEAENLLQQQASAHLKDEEAAAAAAAAEALAATHLAPDRAERDGPGAAAAAQAAASQHGVQDDNGEVQEQQGQQQVEEQQPAGQDTPLHKAAKAGDPERVRRLLDGGHDPCARDAKGRAPYALAADKDTRDAFRRFMAQHPDRWDYSTSGIPSPLTEEMEAAQQAKKAAHKAKLKAKDAERKAASAEERKRAEQEAAESRRKAVEDEIAQAAAEAAAIAARLNASASTSTSKGPGGSRAGGAGGGGGSSKVGASGGGGGGGKGGKAAGAKGAQQQQRQQPQQQAAAAPSPEELARRREMMAAAAEARMRALTQASQQQKLW